MNKIFAFATLVLLCALPATASQQVSVLPQSENVLRTGWSEELGYHSLDPQPVQTPTVDLGYESPSVPVVEESLAFSVSQFIGRRIENATLRVHHYQSISVYSGGYVLASDEGDYMDWLGVTSWGNYDVTSRVQTALDNGGATCSFTLGSHVLSYAYVYSSLSDSGPRLDVQLAPVPEPSSLIALLGGLLGLGGLKRRRGKARLFSHNSTGCGESRVGREDTMGRPYLLPLSAILALLCCGTVSNADPKMEWFAGFRAHDYYNHGTSAWLACGTQTGASDEWTPGYQNGDDHEQPIADGSYGGCITVDAVGSTMPLVTRDFRSPIAIGEVQVWNLRAWLVDTSGNRVAGLLYIRAWTGSSSRWSTDDSISLSVRGLGDDWVVPNGVPSSLPAPLRIWSFDYDGQNDIEFLLVATGISDSPSNTVAEPSSIIALLGGFAGIVGVKRRR